MATLDILTLANDAFALPLAVLGRSILDHLEPGYDVGLTVLDGGISRESQRRLERSWDQRIHARFVTPSNTALSGLASAGRIPPLTFGRLLVGSILQNCHRVLILDADQLVLVSLAELFREPFDGAIALSPVDAFIPTLASPLGLTDPGAFGLQEDQPFLSGAVMMIDLEAWRRGSCEESAIRIAVQNASKLQTHDQDVLNILLAGRWRALDPRWQVQPRLATLRRKRDPDTAWIVHFSGRLKPWLYRGPSIWDQRFRETLSRTAFSDSAAHSSIRGLLYRVYDSPLRRLFYPLEWRADGFLRRVTRKHEM